MKRINDRETAMNELAAFFGGIFNIRLDARYLYDAYSNIKHRKNDSRTYFLDKMRYRLNLCMQRDDEKELNRHRWSTLYGRENPVRIFYKFRLFAFVISKKFTIIT